MLQIDYTKESYYRNKTHNTMTEDFVLKIPKTLTEKDHQRALKGTFSPMSKFFEQAIMTQDFKQQAYELMLSQEAFMKLTFPEDVSATQTASILRIYAQASS